MSQKRADKGILDFIGGCMELGESSGDTFVREFRGESGIEIESLCLSMFIRILRIPILMEILLKPLGLLMKSKL